MTVAKTKTGRLAAWAGLDLGEDIAGEVPPLAPAPGAEPRRLQGHSFLRLAIIKASRVTGPPSGPACS